MCKGKIKSFQADDKKLFYKLRKNIYHKKKILGEGSFGKVILVEKKDDIGSCNSKKFALKINKRFVYISKKDSSVISSEEEDEIPEGINFIELRELIIMKKIRHPNVIHLRDYKLCRKARAVWILMDYLPTELGTFFLKNKENKDIMNEKFFKNIAYQILNGVNYLHKKGIIHRDLKLENIFYDDVKKVVRIGDFGLSRLINYDLSCQYTDVGTYPYKPPELILGLKNYSFTFDIWSIGCILVEICTGCHLFGENDAIGVLKLMYEIFGSFNYTMLPKLKSFPYSKILENLPEKKGIGLVNYIKSKQKFDFENELFFDFIEKILCIDPEKRVTAKECLNHPWLANIDISKIYLKNKNE